MNKETLKVLTNGKILNCNQPGYTLKDAGIFDGSQVIFMGGSLMEEFHKKAYPSGYNRPLATGVPTNVIASRLGALRAMH